MNDLIHFTYRQARKIVVLVIGLTVVLIGIALLVLPGPAFVVIPTGLAILAIEFTWARRWLNKLREAVDGVGDSMARRVFRSEGESRDDED